MKAAVVGSGAWGTALAIRLAKNGHDTTLWFRSPEKASYAAAHRENPAIAGIPFPESLAVSADPACVSGCDMVVIACPSFPIRSVCRTIAPFLDKNVTMVSVTKGIEPGTLMRMSQVIEEETGHCVVALTGPSHAEEVAIESPTGCLSACPNKEKAELVQDAFMSDSFRVYTSPDIIGAELGGALKNIIALCAGIADGLGYGDNTKAMLMTRGLTEIARLGVSLGAQKETFAGLAGIGDLIVTCTSMHSRNRRAGILIGQGHSVEDAMAQVGAVVESYYATRSAWDLAQKQQVTMPILHAAYSVLYGGTEAKETVQMLLLRQKTAESQDGGWM